MCSVDKESDRQHKFALSCGFIRYKIMNGFQHLQNSEHLIMYQFDHSVVNGKLNTLIYFLI